MFRIDRKLVNLAGEASRAPEIYENIVGVTGYNGPLTPTSAQARAREMIEEAEAEAAEIIEEAQIEAERLLQSAKEMLEVERAQAWHIGYDEGAVKASAEYENKMAQDDEMLQQVLREIYEERAEICETLEAEAVELSMQIARTIIGEAIEEYAEAYESLIVNALRRMEHNGKIVIKVGSREFDRFFPTGNAVFKLGDGVTVTATIQKDTALGDGECTIDSDEGNVNAGVDTQMRLIRLAFSRAEENE